MQKYTIEQLKNCSREEMICIVLQIQQENAIFAERLSVCQADKFGRKTEKLNPECEGQVDFFNEAEALADEKVQEPKLDMEAEKPSKNPVPKRTVGDKERSLKGLPVRQISHELDEEQLTEIFGEGGWKRLPDRVYSTVSHTPASLEVHEHHIAVYASKRDDTIVRAPHPVELWPNSIATPSLVASIMNAKYTNHMPLYRIEQHFQQNGFSVPRPTLANWMILSSERYLSLMWDRLRKELLSGHVVQADETPVKVSKDGRSAGASSYMWAYRTGEYAKDATIVLYEYQKTRNAEHPARFLGDFSGVLVCDGFPGYHKLGRENDTIQVANCWAHCRRPFSNAVKALKGKEKKHASRTLAHKALKLISNIYAEDRKAAEMTAEERLDYRRRKVEPLVEAYFAWVREHKDDVPPESETGKGFSYSLNQEAYLKTFLCDGSVPMDNSATERAIRPFTIGRKNWQMIDTIHGAKASAVIYSIVETAKANGLKVYDYLQYLLTKIPEHMDDTNTDFLDDLLPWSPAIPDSCKKQKA